MFLSPALRTCARNSATSDSVFLTPALRTCARNSATTDAAPSSGVRDIRQLHVAPRVNVRDEPLGGRLHATQHRRRINAEPHDRRDERHHDRELPSIEI